MDDQPKRVALVAVGIPAPIRPERVAVVAEEPGILVPPIHVVLREVQGVGPRLPIRNEGGHEVVHGKIRVLIDPPADGLQIPSAAHPGVAEGREVHGPPGRHDEEVPHAGVVVDVPVGGAGEAKTVRPIPSNVVVLTGNPGVEEPDDSVGVDMEDRHIGVRRGPVVYAGPIAPVEDVPSPSLDPDPGLEVVEPLGGRRLSRHGCTDESQKQQPRDPAGGPHGSAVDVVVHGEAVHDSPESCARPDLRARDILWQIPCHVTRAGFPGFSASSPSRASTPEDASGLGTVTPGGRRRKRPGPGMETALPPNPGPGTF